MTVEEALEHVVSRRNLREAEARDLMDVIIGGAATPTQISALLVALRMKGETVSELTGFARAMRAKAVPLPHSRANVVDTCGTGGDAIKTFNLSTAAAIVSAAAGAPIAKHGNRAFTSRCGSADVLEALGVNLNLDPIGNGRLLDEVGLAFMFAPNHHPAMKNAAAPRREIKIRTVFNMVGPLTNPAGAQRQLVGVFAPALVSKIASALVRLGCHRGVVAHGLLGLDEVSPIGGTRVAIIDGRKVTEKVIQAEEFGISSPKLADISCDGGIEHAVDHLRTAITDAESPQAAAVLPSAGVAIWLAEISDTITEGVQLAQHAISNGSAKAKLDELVARSNGG